MIEASYLYTEKVAATATVEVTKSVNRFFNFLPWLGGFMVLTSILSALVAGIPIKSMFVTMGIGGALIFVRLYTPFAAKKNFRRSPLAEKTITWKFSETELENNSDGTVGRFAWRHIIKTEERDSGFLLFPQPRVAHWIPKSAFQNNDDLNKFRQYAGLSDKQRSMS